MKWSLLTMDGCNNPPRPRSTNQRAVRTKEPGTGVGIVSRLLRGAECKDAGRCCLACTAPGAGWHGTTSAAGLGTRVRTGPNAATLIPALNQNPSRPLPTLDITTRATPPPRGQQDSSLPAAAYPSRNRTLMPNDLVKIALPLPGGYQERMGAHMIHFRRADRRGAEPCHPHPLETKLDEAPRLTACLQDRSLPSSGTSGPNTPPDLSDFNRQGTINKANLIWSPSRRGRRGTRSTTNLARAEDAPLAGGPPCLSGPCCSCWLAARSDYNPIPISSPRRSVKGGGGNTDALEAVSDGTGGGGGCYPLLTRWTPRGAGRPGLPVLRARTIHIIYGISPLLPPAFALIVFGPFFHSHCVTICRFGRITAPKEAGRETCRIWEYQLPRSFCSMGICSLVGLVRCQTFGCVCRLHLSTWNGPNELETDGDRSLAVHHMPLKACALHPAEVVSTLRGDDDTCRLLNFTFLSPRLFINAGGSEFCGSSAGSSSRVAVRELENRKHRFVTPRELFPRPLPGRE